MGNTAMGPGGAVRGPRRPRMSEGQPCRQHRVPGRRLGGRVPRSAEGGVRRVRDVSRGTHVLLRTWVAAKEVVAPLARNANYFCKMLQIPAGLVLHRRRMQREGGQALLCNNETVFRRDGSRSGEVRLLFALLRSCFTNRHIIPRAERLEADRGEEIGVRGFFPCEA